MGNNSVPYEIVHCSSWDDDYHPQHLVESNPGNHIEQTLTSLKCKGWQTPKCPEYPQDLIIHLLSGTTRITKVQILSHHFKIATKIDVYIGILKDAQDVLLQDIIHDAIQQDEDEDNMLIEFTRLGYVCFDNNARAQYRARELKSIKINADGEYIRLVVRNCHRNRLNTYNQVGILALNILGEPLQEQHGCNNNNNNSASNNSSQIRHHHPFDDNSILSSSTRRTSVSSNSSNSINKLSLTSGNELELQQWTSALFAAEEEAVLKEQYQIAKTYKYLGDKLERFTKILSDLEIGKRHAVETKDYDEAEKIKDDIKEIKQAAQQLLKQANVTIDGIHVHQKEEEEEQVMEEEEEEEEFIIPTSYEQLESNTTIIDYPSVTRIRSHQLSSPSIPMVAMDQQQQQTIPLLDSDSIPEPIMEEERIPYKLPIHIFGQDIVACVLSIKVKCRKRGLEMIQEYILSVSDLHQDQLLAFLQDDEEEEAEEEEDDDDVETRCISNFINATLMMIQEAIMDSRELIVLLAISIWQQLHQLILKQSSNSINEWMAKTFSGLLKRTSDANPNIKLASTNLIIQLLKSFKFLSTCFICKPERLIHNYKEATLRIELVESIVLEMGISFSLPDLMAFVVAYLNHTHLQVKETAVKLVVTISDQIGFKTVSSYIDQSLLLSLTETVQKLVNDKDFQQKQQQQTQKKKTTKETMSELRALSVQQPEKKKTTVSNKKTATVTATATTKATKSTKAPLTTKAATTKSTVTKTTATKTSASRATSRAAKPPPPSAAKDENNVCIFCDEQNPEFNEDTLIKHYYNACPVLTSCPMCQIITEISTLNEHMLMDCDRRHLIKQCTRCKQAIPVEQWLQHTLKQVCKLKKDDNDVKCPLCAVQIDPPNDAGWKIHLMTGSGCTKLKKSRALKRKT